MVGWCSMGTFNDPCLTSFLMFITDDGDVNPLWTGFCWWKVILRPPDWWHHQCREQFPATTAWCSLIYYGFVWPQIWCFTTCTFPITNNHLRIYLIYHIFGSLQSSCSWWHIPSYSHDILSTLHPHFPQIVLPDLWSGTWCSDIRAFLLSIAGHSHDKPGIKHWISGKKKSMVVYAASMGTSW